MHRRSLAEYLGSNAWSVYRNLLQVRDRHGLVRFKVATLARKLGEWWAKLTKPRKAPSERMVRAYLRRLEEIGLVVNTGRRTGGGCRIRAVMGVREQHTEYVRVPPAVARAVSQSTPIPYNNAARRRVVAPRVACCAVAASPEDRPPAHPATPTSPEDSAPVGVAGDVGTSFPLKGKGHAQARGSRNIQVPEHFPVRPTEVTGHYQAPPRPKVAKTDPTPRRVAMLLAAYRAAVHKHTGQAPGLFSRGASKRQMGLLVKAADHLERHRVSPYLWAVWFFQYTKDAARDENRTWVPPRLEQVFAPSLIDQLRAPCREQGGDWGCPFWMPNRLELLLERWKDCRAEIMAAMRNPAATQQDVDRMVAAFFPPGYFDREVDLCRRDMQARYARDLAEFRAGRWPW